LPARVRRGHCVGRAQLRERLAHKDNGESEIADHIAVDREALVKAYRRRLAASRGL
jgi:hypothetical protein